MARYVIDQKVAIGVTKAVTKPKARIEEIYVNGTKVYPYTYTQPKVSKKAGDKVTVTVRVRNTGDGSGILWCQIIDKDTGYVPEGFKAMESASAVSPGSVYTFSFSETMPNRDWHLEVWAGHVE